MFASPRYRAFGIAGIRRHQISTRNGSVPHSDMPEDGPRVFRRLADFIRQRRWLSMRLVAAGYANFLARPAVDRLLCMGIRGSTTAAGLGHAPMG